MRHESSRAATILAAALLSLLPPAAAQAQHGPLPPWKVLADQSSTVVVADVEEGLIRVNDSEKQIKEEGPPEHRLARLGNPAAYLIGMLARARVSEVIKNDGKIRPGDMIRVLVYGPFGYDMPDDPMPKDKRVFFLRAVDPEGAEFTHAVVQRIERTEVNGHPRYTDLSYKFDPKGCYTPVENGYAQVLIPPDKLDRIDKIKQAIAKGP